MWKLVIGFLAALAMLSPLSGCNGPRPVPADPDQALKAEFDWHSSQVVQDRFLIVPISQSVSKFRISSSAGVKLAYSAWSGPLFATDYERRLNLEVVDLVERRRDRVFDRQVALGGWSQSFMPGGAGVLRFANLLLLMVRGADTNGDRVIDEHDTAAVYAYDLAARKLRKLSPDGFSAERVAFTRERLVLTLRNEDTAKAAVYSVDPVSGEGTIVVDGLTP